MQNILEDTAKYYTQKIQMYGTTPRGVDWRDEESQVTRFEQLLKICNFENSFLLNDLGCGYGRLAEYFKPSGRHKYIGYDISNTMIEQAKREYGHFENCEFRQILKSSEMEVADYSVASGIFNVKMSYKESEWLHYITSTLDDMFEKTTRGFSFNLLTSYSDKELMRSDLFYGNPLFFFDYCKRNYSRNVSLNHDYDLYEFTILVRK